ncbi:DegT/DnrJ/EryC1/StrS family aminotransferase [Azospirillum doebereinerae]|uniref:DegT/DnrJ/EryC1/StrS family aminotransferase n=1 Tax=Azospirillum doebereinerae TaxID=92933 RepID=UPI001EE570AD|nr:DegT/DnrJ/EryC1/StrS family aminotransferase [Azospirillum doebereinerae]MCG5238766.1 DegT/DnrJ/EryC1/StrS family aminotransferase [Azospirillum doebereinerae]
MSGATTLQRVPFVNLARQIERLRPELVAAFEAVLDDRAFIKGPHVAAFEAAFAKALGVPHAVGCANGTAALSLALEAAGIGPGDEVIVPSLTFIATGEAVCHVGATPVFCDIDPDSYTLDPEDLLRRLTPRTRAVVPVHLYGTPADMGAILAIAADHRLVVIEDCAQAHLATYHGRTVGTLGTAGGFSFFPGKNLGALGDAGMVTTSDPDLAESVVKLADHGRLSKYEHDRIGHNQRLDGLQAALLAVKLPHLAEWTERRRRIARYYDARLRPAGIKTIVPPAGADPVHHLYVIEVDDRPAVVARLAASGVETGVHYPIPLHLQPAFRGRHGYERLPNAERAAARVLSLPICGEITVEEAAWVCDRVLDTLHPTGRRGG